MKEAVKSLARSAGLTRQVVAAARLCCERHVIATFPRTLGSAQPRKVGRILCYHSVGQPSWGVNDISPGLFRRQIELALAAGFRFVRASDIVRTGGGEKDLAITFDDGLRSVFTHAAPILADYGIPWSLFVVSEWSEGRGGFKDGTILRWRELEELAGAGVEIGSHSMTHPNFAHIETAQVEDELGTSRRIIEERLGIVADTFAIPLGQSHNWTAIANDAARRVGYSVVYAQAEETRPPGTVPRTFVTRFDSKRIWEALLGGAFDRWEEWV